MAIVPSAPEHGHAAPEAVPPVFWVHPAFASWGGQPRQPAMAVRAAPGGDPWPELRCQQLLRVLPGVRVVYRGTWQGTPAVVKWFTCPRRARAHLRREWNAFSRLRQLGIPVPDVLLGARLPDASTLLVTRQLDGAPAAAGLDIGAPTGTRAAVLLALAGLLAQLHRHGVIQGDLHPGNFVITPGGPVLVDPARVHILPLALPPGDALAQIAQLLAQVPGLAPAEAEAFAAVYRQARDWPATRLPLALLWRQRAREVRRGLRRAARKCLRDTSAHRRVEAPGFTAVLRRGFLGDRDPAELVAALDDLIAGGISLKRGGACTLARASWHGADLVIKRYNARGFWHTVRHTLQGSRARRSWRHARFLELLGVATPTPLGFVEVRRGPLVTCSYYLSAFVEAPTARDVLRRLPPGEPGRAERERILAGLERVLQRLDPGWVTHGDLKLTNFLVPPAGGELVVTDLDAMWQHRLWGNFRWDRWRDRLRLAQALRELGLTIPPTLAA